MKKITSIVIFILITLVGISIINNKGEEKYNNLYKREVKGIISSIRYGVKSQVIVFIKEEELSLFLFDIRKGDGLFVGDSLYKAKNSKTLELYSKSSNGKYIYTQDFEMKK